MKKILNLITSLTLISVVCAAVLATVNSVTKAKIQEIKQQAKVNAAKKVMPPVVKTIQALPATDDGEESYVGMKHDGEQVAWAVIGISEKGYGGRIRLMVGFTENLNVVTFCKLEANETPGLGANLVLPDFIKQFAGMSATKDIHVKKDGGEVEALTAATITSRAVCDAINNARTRLHQILKAK